jgi:putative Mg2+ transporter-C (MgtC) family protein
MRDWVALDAPDATEMVRITVRLVMAAGLAGLFVGAGAILKATERGEIHGLTTAAGIWMTAGIGVAVGAGRFWLPVLATVLALVALAFLRRHEAVRDEESDDTSPP